jgi:hypothetical protein
MTENFEPHATEDARPSSSTLNAQSPFAGLRPYRFEDYPFFFGRQENAFSLCRLLDRNRFVAVVGGAGSGKSSLVLAGLLPLLRRETEDPNGRRWRWVPMRPGPAPIDSLSDALGSLVPEPDEHEEFFARRERVASRLRRSSFGIADALNDIDVPADETLVLIIDQFEELFRYSTFGREVDEDAAMFVQLLLQSVRQSDYDLRVLLIMRSDFIGGCARFPDLDSTITSGLFLIPELRRDQIEQTILGPIRHAGATMEPLLLQRLLNDSADARDRLAILQHCLRRLWERAGAMASLEASAEGATRHLTAAQYHEIGGLALAISQHGDEVMASLPKLDSVVEGVFRSLTGLEREGRVYRRPVAFYRLVRETGCLEHDVRRVIDRFRADDCAFLLPPLSLVDAISDDTVIDLAHEAIASRWNRLAGDPGATGESPDPRRAGWLLQEQFDARRYQALLTLTEHSGNAILSGAQAREFSRWWMSSRGTTAWAERYGGQFDRVSRILRLSIARARWIRRLGWVLGVSVALLLVVETIVILKHAWN